MKPNNHSPRQVCHDATEDSLFRWFANYSARVTACPKRALYGRPHRKLIGGAARTASRISTGLPTGSRCIPSSCLSALGKDVAGRRLMGLSL